MTGTARAGAGVVELEFREALAKSSVTGGIEALIVGWLKVEDRTQSYGAKVELRPRDGTYKHKKKSL